MLVALLLCGLCDLRGFGLIGVFVFCCCLWLLCFLVNSVGICVLLFLLEFVDLLLPVVCRV